MDVQDLCFSHEILLFCDVLVTVAVVASFKNSLFIRRATVQGYRFDRAVTKRHSILC